MQRESNTEGTDERAPGEVLLSRWRTWLPWVLATMFVAIGVGLLAYSPRAIAATHQAAGCPDGNAWPAPSPGVPLYTDNNVAEFVGGNYRSNDALTQAEGLMVIVGNATFGNGRVGVSEVGTIAVGSRVDPSPGDVMLAVGGSLRVLGPSQLSVGGASIQGGHVDVGGSVTQGSRVHSNGGGIRQDLGAAAVERFRLFKARLEDESLRLSKLVPTGSADLIGSTLYFTGDGRSVRQVFSVDEELLAGAEVIDIKDIPTGAVAVVNVLGTAPSLDPRAFDQGGVDIDSPPSAAGASWAAHILWNFERAALVRIGGTTPILGSVLVPRGAAIVANDIEGRLYVANDLTRSGESVAQTNYPWLGSSVFGCQPQAAVVVTAAPETPTAVDPARLTRNVIGTGLIALAIVLLARWSIARVRQNRQYKTEVARDDAEASR